MELNRIHLDITQLKQTHTSRIDQMDSSFNAKLLYEYQKYESLKQEMDTMKDQYERYGQKNLDRDFYGLEG